MDTDFCAPQKVQTNEKPDLRRHRLEPARHRRRLAQPYYGNHGGNDRFYQDRGHDYRGGYRGHNDGALISLGIGLFALAAIAASSMTAITARRESPMAIRTAIGCR